MSRNVTVMCNYLYNILCSDQAKQAKHCLANSNKPFNSRSSDVTLVSDDEKHLDTHNHILNSN